jgi:hypothetical protein
MSFRSILFETAGRARIEEAAAEPDFFRDLNLDQIVDAITGGRKEYNLKPFFHISLTDPAEISYRQEVMRDLEREALFQCIKSFSSQIRSMRLHLSGAQQRDYKYEKDAWFLDAVKIYCAAVEALLGNLSQHDPNSRGLLAFRTYLAEYAGSENFLTLKDRTQKLKSGLAAIRYCLLINGDSVTVRSYDSEPDYSVAIEKAFLKFKQGAVKDYLVKFPELSGMGHVGAMVLDRVGLLHPDLFRALDDYCTTNAGFLDQTIARFDREIQFYIAWLEYAAVFKRAGLKFCYPRVSDTFKNISNQDGFDLALAGKLMRENSAVICNDFALAGAERIFVVTGPNQGGKTTFSRAFGQIHYLAGLGCQVPGVDAQLFLFDRLFTHFERAEDVTNLRGKLEDDLIRIHHIFRQATPNSIMIINEIFMSTTAKDALNLSQKIMERISQLDALCVFVTFLDELSAFNEKTVSLVASVAPDEPTVRTYKIGRRPANGLAYALAIAEKYGLTSERLKQRMKP